MSAILLSPVSAHAAVRWLERVEGMDLASILQEMRESGRDANCESEIMRHLWRTRRVSSRNVCRRILTPMVLAAVAAGARKIMVGDAVLVLTNGIIVTVTTPVMRRNDGNKIGKPERWARKRREAREEANEAF